ncbi:MAG: cell division protein FtsQ/DivIB [Actinomycetota bacterium]
MTVGGQRSGSFAARAIIGVVLLGAGVWVVLNSAFFSIRDIRVLGTRHVADTEILRIAAVEEGDNLVTLPTGEVAARLEGHPWIAIAMVQRDLPTTVVIRVLERHPVGWIEDPDGPVVVAGDGTALAREQRPPRTLPALGSWPEALAPGDTIGGLTEPLRISSAMSPWLRHRIASADFDDGDVVLELRDGGSVLYGTPTDVTAKNRALGSMLRWAEEQGIAVRAVDVRVPSAPSLAPVGGSAIPTPIPSP